MTVKEWCQLEVMAVLALKPWKEERMQEKTMEIVYTCSYLNEERLLMF